MLLPRELIDAVDRALRPDDTAPPVSERPEVAMRLSVALECWLHGAVTTEQAIGVLRTQPPARGSRRR